MFDNEPSVFRFLRRAIMATMTARRRAKDASTILVHGFCQNSSNLALSISVANPFLSSLPPHPKKVGSSRAQKEPSKNKKYLADCYKKNTTFHPFVMDAYRGISPEALLVRLQASL